MPAALLVTLLAARPAQAQGRGDRALLDAPSPSAADAGWFGLTLGLSQAFVDVGIDGQEPVANGEGSSSGGATYALSYEKQIWRWFGARGFLHRAGWSTDWSDAMGDGDRSMYDLGGAPVLGFGLSRKVSLYFYFPVSFSWSYAPVAASRGALQETTDIGRGFRLGLGGGFLFRFSGALGMSVELEDCYQDVRHQHRFRRLDDSGGEEQLELEYRMSWLGLSLGLALFP